MVLLVQSLDRLRKIVTARFTARRSKVQGFALLPGKNRDLSNGRYACIISVQWSLVRLFGSLLLFPQC
jgi:hypothetical protein